MEVLSEIIFWYFAIVICVYVYLLVDDYLIIKKYGKELFYKFSPLDNRCQFIISLLWPLILMFGLFILFQKFFGEYNEKNK